MSDPLHADLCRLARAGDRAALDLVLAALPPVLPSHVRRAWRDSRIRATASWLRSTAPGMSDRRAAALIAAAGAVVDDGLDPAARVFAILTPDERAELLRTVGSIVAAMPRRAHGGRWMTSRMVQTILAEKDVCEI